MSKDYHSFKDYIAYQNKNIRNVRRNTSNRRSQRNEDSTSNFSKNSKSQSDKDFLTTLIEFMLWLFASTKLLLWGIYSSLREMSRTPLTSLFNSFVIGLVLSLPSAGLIVFGNFGNIISFQNSEPHITIYLENSVNQAEIQSIQNKLSHNPDIKSVKYISKKQALEEIQKDTQLAEIVSTLEGNPLPDAFVLTPKITDLKSLEHLTKELKKLSKAISVQIDNEWVKKIDALIAVIQQIILLSGFLMSGMVLVVIGNTIHLQILAKKSELEICLLLGATTHFIQKPFIFFGITQGLMGGIIAGLIIEIALRILNSTISKIATTYAFSFKITGIDGADVIFLLLVASLFGGLGAFLSVKQNLKSLIKN